jgi:hypothetical protein
MARQEWEAMASVKSTRNGGSVSIPSRDLDKMRRLTQEGKSIASIWRDDFQEAYDYWDIFWAVGEGQASAVGMQRSITNRLKKLATCDPSERSTIIQEVGDLGRRLYDNMMINQKKLESIRKVLGE